MSTRFFDIDWSNVCCWCVEYNRSAIVGQAVESISFRTRTVQTRQRLGLSQSRKCSVPEHGHYWLWPLANASHPQVRSCTTLWFDQFAQKVWQSPGRGWNFRRDVWCQWVVAVASTLVIDVLGVLQILIQHMIVHDVLYCVRSAAFVALAQDHNHSPLFFMLYH